MGDFFKPWRRKIGVVTLVMACGLAAFWIKSSILHDLLTWNLKTTSYYVESCVGQMHFVSNSFLPDRDFVESRDFEKLMKLWVTGKMPTFSHISQPLLKFWGYERDDDGRLSYHPLQRSKINWQYEFAGFHISDSGKIEGLPQGIKIRSIRCIVPYWSIVIPLTLLSAWLLLRRFEPSLDVERARRPSPLVEKRGRSGQGR